MKTFCGLCLIFIFASSAFYVMISDGNKYVSTPQIPDETNGECDEQPKPIRVKVSKYQALQGHTDGVTSVKFSPDDLQVLTSCSDGSIRRFNVENAKLLSSYPLFINKNNRFPYYSVDYSPDGKYFVTSGPSFASASVFQCCICEIESGLVKGRIAKTGATYAKYDPDGTSVATISSKEVKIWSAPDGREMLAFKPHMGWVTAIDYSSDSKLISSSDSGGKAIICDASNGKSKCELNTDGSKVVGLSFIRNTHDVLLICGDGHVVRCDGETGKETARIKLKSSGHAIITVSSDGKLAAVGTASGELMIVDLKSKEILYSQQVHKEKILGMCFSSDRKMIATASSDRLATIWKIEN